MERKLSWRTGMAAALAAALVLLACDITTTTPSSNKPTVVISSPASGSTYAEGEDVAVQSTAADPQGIARVELWVDNAVVRSDASPMPQGQTTYTLIQTWKATPGAHTLMVRAYNTVNAVSDPAAINIAVNPAASPVPTQPLPPPATVTPQPTATSTSTTVPPPPAACTNNTAFVADVTIPDGSVIGAGQSFVKTWRIRNAGSCTWDATYTFAFAGGEQMGGASPQAVPVTAPNGTADLSVTMVAPTAPGSHTGTWQMRAPNGVFFGSSVRVMITVPSPAAPTATNTVPAPPPPPPPPSCSGTPNIPFFNAAPNPITAGSNTTLSWGLVTNATAVSIDQGIGGVATPGSVVVSPGSTTTYILTAVCGPSGGTATRSVTVTVNPGVPPAPAQSSPPNGAVLTAFPRVATFTWNPVAFPGGVTYNIEIQVYIPILGGGGSWHAHDSANGLTGTSFTMSEFHGDNQGRWRVWATSPTAGDGPKSSWWSFSFHTGP